MFIEPLLCQKCGLPHGLKDYDAGSDREIARMCKKCFEENEALIKLNNALVSVRTSMDHPRMDSANQYYEIAKMMYEVAKDKHVRKAILNAIILY